MSDLVKRLRTEGAIEAVKRDAADEIERLTAERDEARSEAASHRNGLAVVAAKRDALAVQVAALREALENEAEHRPPCPSAIRVQGESDPKFIAWLALPEDQQCTCAWKRVLTDTAAAARECERRLRIEGAEAMEAEWVRCTTRGLEVPRPAAVVDAKWPPAEGGTT